MPKEIDYSKIISQKQMQVKILNTEIRDLLYLKNGGTVSVLVRYQDWIDLEKPDNPKKYKANLEWYKNTILMNMIDDMEDGALLKGRDYDTIDIVSKFIWKTYRTTILYGRFADDQNRMMDDHIKDGVTSTLNKIIKLNVGSFIY